MNYLNRVTVLLCLLFPLSVCSAAYFDDLQTKRVDSTPLVQWQHFGPGMSGYIDMFWINRGDPNAMYTSLDMGNGHVTLNRGDSWTSMRDWDAVGNHPDYFIAMDFSHTNPDFGLAVKRDVTLKQGQIFQTTDRGLSWSLLSVPIAKPEEGHDERHTCISVDPSNDKNWYIGAGGGAFIKDMHYSKSGVKNTSPWATNYSEGFILYSKNSGKSWSKVSSPFPGDAIFSRIIVDPRDSNKVYASCQYGVYKSTNGGKWWTKVPGNGLPFNKPRYMDSYYNQSTGEFILYIVELTHYNVSGRKITTKGGVYRSGDGGTNWNNLTGDLAIDMSKITLYAYKDKFRRAVNWWQDQDLSYNDFYQDYDVPTQTFSQFHQIAVDPKNKNRVYLVHNFKHDYSFPPGNIWMTENGGKNWYAAAREGTYWSTLSSRTTDHNYWKSRAIQPLGTNVTFAHVDREHRENIGQQTGPRFLKVNKHGEVYTAFAQQVMRSINNGNSWVQIDDDETKPGSGHWVGRGNSNLPGETLCVDTGTPGTYLFGSGEHGLWRNTDDGDLVYPGAIAVEQLVGQCIADDEPTSIATIAVDPNNSNKIYTLQFRQDKRNHLRYSWDGGKSWMTRSKPFPNMDIRSQSLMVDHGNSNILYFTIPFTIWSPYGGNGAFRANASADASVYGIYKSTDAGVTWNKSDNGIPAGSSVYRLCQDPNNDKTLYAALPQTHKGTIGGLYRSTNRGGWWKKLTVPNGVRSVNDVTVHKQTGAIYIACGRREADGTPGGAYVSRDGGATWKLIFDMPYVRGVDVCDKNANVIAINVGQDLDIQDLNAGCYVSVDGGTKWNKINRRHGQPEKVTELKTDPYDDQVLWCSLNGTGFFRADISLLSSRGGLAYSYFKKNGMSSVNDLPSTPESAGMSRNFDIDVTPTVADNFGYIFDGLIRIPTSGTYTFYTSSDDGSVLFIDDKMVVDNDGLHAYQERSGELYLAAGYHPIQVQFFERSGQEKLIVSWEGPGIAKQAIPDEQLYSVAPGYLTSTDGRIWTWNGSKFVRFGPLDSRLSTIDVGNKDVPWGINASGAIYKWNGSGWTFRGSDAQDIAVGSRVFVTKADDTIWVFQNGSLVRFGPTGGRLQKIAVSDNGTPWGINKWGAVYSWNGSGWTKRGSDAQSVAAGGGKVFLTKTDQTVWEWNGSAFVRFGPDWARFVQIDVDLDGIPWGINENGGVYMWDGGKWVYVMKGLDLGM